MLLKTKGIVLHYIRYRETGLIVYVYTPDYGRQNLLIQGVTGKKKKEKASLFQPLYILDLDIYYKQGAGLHRIKEARNLKPYISIPHNIIKSSIAVFISELLYKCLKTEEKDNRLFEFLENAFQIFDHCTEAVHNFHLVFLLKLTRYLGFYPNTSGDNTPDFFDLREGCFLSSPPNHPFYVTGEYSRVFLELLGKDLHKLKEIKMDNKTRAEMLDHILDYYNLHEQDIENLRSVKVMREVFGSD